MKKILKHWFKEYNSYSKSDRFAINIIGALILLVLIAIVIVDNIPAKSKYNYSDFAQYLEKFISPKIEIASNAKSLFKFDPNAISSEALDSLEIPDFVKQNMISYRKSGGSFKTPGDVRKIYGMNDSIYNIIEKYIIIAKSGNPLKPALESQTIIFEGFIDPNIDNFERLTEFGFNPFQAKNIVEYRNKGGIFKIADDLMKIYGIDSVYYESIKKHILIADSKVLTDFDETPPKILIEINSADSTDFLKIVGIGPAYSSRILKYRELLGGFYSTNQLLEIYNFPEETYRSMENNITVDTAFLKKIRINFAEYPELLRHPYLNKKQVETILNYRNKNGAFKNILQLKTNGLVDSETFVKISPYLTCR